MISQKQIEEIREHLEKAQNPIFLFDNDPDGLCSFLLLRRYIGRGKGFPVKSFPGLTDSYVRKVNELNADYVFILDKPVVDEDFFKEIEKTNVPVVWIDHHKLQQKVPPFVNYYNSLKNSEGGEPVTYMSYKISDKKEDLWIALIGCISDMFFPEFYSDFKKKYPDLAINSDNAPEVLYKSVIGKMCRIMSFALKDRTTNVISMIRFLIESETPYDILEKNSKNYNMHKRFEQIDRKYQKFLNKAREVEKNSDNKNILFFQYGGDLSISSDISNELKYDFPEKVVVVAYVIGAKTNISVRGKKIREKVLDVIKNLEDATGGGHEDAVGARVKTEDLERFRNNLENMIDSK
jgi:single-stranded DNA-specific DHH superfamily exonuclease